MIVNDKKKSLKYWDAEIMNDFAEWLAEYLHYLGTDLILHISCPSKKFLLSIKHQPHHYWSLLHDSCCLMLDLKKFKEEKQMIFRQYT